MATNKKKPNNKKPAPRSKPKVQVMRKCALPEAEPKLPTEPSVPVDPPFVDARGSIQNLLHRRVGSVVLINSNKGSTRAKHFHKSDWHFCYVLYGEIEYFERPVGSKDAPKAKTFYQGEMFFTGPLVEHEMYFPKDTGFLTLANRHRSPEDYEADLVRLPVSLREIFLLGKEPREAVEAPQVSNGQPNIQTVRS